MRIAFFTHYSHAGGTYFRWHNMAIALQQQGHEVDVYAGDHSWKNKNREEVKDGIHYYIVASLRTVRAFYAPNDFITAYMRLLHLPEKEYDVYHLFQPFANAYIPWNFLKKRKKESAFIYDWDDLWIGGLMDKPGETIRQSYVQKVTAKLEKKIPGKSDAVTVCSNFLAERTDNENIKILYNGFWPGAIPERSSVRRKYQFQDDVFYIGYIGKTSDELSWIVEAFDKIDGAKEKVQLVIVGPPKSQIESFSKSQQAKMLYLGAVSSAEAVEIAAALDLGLIPLANNLFNQSRFPIKFFDFLSVGTPIYMSDVGEIALLGKGMEKVIVGSSDKIAWMDGLGKAIQIMRGKQFENSSTDMLTSQFSWPAIAKEQVAFYKNILEKKLQTTVN